MEVEVRRQHEEHFQQAIYTLSGLNPLTLKPFNTV